MLLNTVLYGQEHRIVVMETNDPCTLVCPCDTIDDYVVYHKKRFASVWVDRKETNEESPFYINIPLGLKYRESTHNYTNTESVFDDGERVIIITIYFKQKNEEPFFFYSPYCELDDNQITNKIWHLPEKNIDNNKYFGYYIFGKYFIYYYNVEQKDVKLFNFAITSIRDSCH
jgi:hypothetical protein